MKRDLHPTKHYPGVTDYSLLLLGAPADPWWLSEEFTRTPCLSPGWGHLGLLVILETSQTMGCCSHPSGLSSFKSFHKTLRGGGAAQGLWCILGMEGQCGVGPGDSGSGLGSRKEKDWELEEGRNNYPIQPKPSACRHVS